VLAASVSGATAPTCPRLWYMVPIQLHRRQLHRLQAERGGVRRPYGGTRSLGFRRGTLVRHAGYRLGTTRGYGRGLRPGEALAEPACLPDKPAPHPGSQAGGLLRAHRVGVSRMVGAVANAVGEEAGACSPGPGPGLRPGVSAPHCMMSGTEGLPP